MKQINVKTNLVGRQDVFRILALAHATGYPVLLVGPPGTGKTKALLDYAQAMNGNNATDAIEKTFILETDEGTRSAEVKGRVDLDKMFKNNEVEINSPITRAEFVMINEVDKANAGLRNSMLSIMNEKFLFNGKQKVPCNWKLFCSSCNEIPADEINSPFWDRYVIKYKLNRITKGQMQKMFRNYGKIFDLRINIPERHELEQLVANIPEAKLSAFVDICFPHLTDRSISYAPNLIAGTGVVFDLTINKALVQTADILINKEIASQVAKAIEPQVLTDIRSKIELIEGMQDYEQIKKIIQEIQRDAKVAAGSKKVTREDLEEVASEVKKVLNNNATWTAGSRNGEKLKAKISGNGNTSDMDDMAEEVEDAVENEHPF
jgi:broad-specificity NMP kinase